MKLQEAYDYIKNNPGTTANIPASVRRANVGVGYDKFRRLETLGYVVSDGEYPNRYHITAKTDTYCHGGESVIIPATILSQMQP